MSFLEGIVQKGLTAIGVDADAAEKIADVVDFGANIAMQNYAGAASDLIDLAGKEDEVPWLCAALDLAGGDPMAGAMGLDQAAMGLDQAAMGTPGSAFGFDLDPRLEQAGQLFARRMGWLPVQA